MDRSNHYEAAFEAYLKDKGLSYIAIDETRPALYGAKTLKNLDFIVHATLLRTCSSTSRAGDFRQAHPTKPRAVWECWSTSDDLEALDSLAPAVWLGYQGLLLFLYDIDPGSPACPTTSKISGVSAAIAICCGRSPPTIIKCTSALRSPRWGTVSLPTPMSIDGSSQPFRISCNRLSRPWKNSTRPGCRQCPVLIDLTCARGSRP